MHFCAVEISCRFTNLALKTGNMFVWHRLKLMCHLSKKSQFDIFDLIVQSFFKQNGDKGCIATTLSAAFDNYGLPCCSQYCQSMFLWCLPIQCTHKYLESLNHLELYLFSPTLQHGGFDMQHEIISSHADADPFHESKQTPYCDTCPSMQMPCETYISPPPLSLSLDLSISLSLWRWRVSSC